MNRVYWMNDRQKHIFIANGHILLFFFSLLCPALLRGQILSKEEIKLWQEPFWKNITHEGILKPEYAYLDSVSFYSISYRSDCLVVKGYIVEPRKAGKYPVVIFNRGGNRHFSALSPATLVQYVARLASSGYLVAASNYREQDEFGGADVGDVLSLMYLLADHPKADTARTGMFGWSRGGMMTYLCLSQTKRIKAAVVGSGPTDLFEVIQQRPEMETAVFAECIPRYEKEKYAALIQRSAFFWPGRLPKEPGILILTATKDDRVPPDQGRKMADTLKSLGYPVRWLAFDTDHYFSDKKQELDKLVIEWFDQELKKPDE